MNIALDWDGTVTADEPTFFKIAQLLKQAGHKLYIVTMRYPSECGDISAAWRELVDGLCCTGRQAKGPYMMQVRDVFIHVWIDDTPRAVHESCMQIWGWETPEGHVITPVHEVTPPALVETLVNTPSD